MTLREYLFHKRMKGKTFSELSGLSVTYISSIKNSKQSPSRHIRVLVEYATGGSVHHIDGWEEEKLTLK